MFTAKRRPASAPVTRDRKASTGTGSGADNAEMGGSCPVSRKIGQTAGPGFSSTSGYTKRQPKYVTLASALDSSRYYDTS